MGNRTNLIFETIRERLEDDEYLEPETIQMEGLDTINVTVQVSWPDDDIDAVEEYIEERRLEILELLPDEANLVMLMA